ncbi:hypothetical protein HSIEG1_3651 [Enterococcus sp. HSIEG1]|nr:hypothetical protein HSIEG1_3651 [Enterococcus sp. HSIEG1]
MTIERGQNKQQAKFVFNDQQQLVKEELSNGKKINRLNSCL